MREIRFFNPFEEIRKWQSVLPHWEQLGASMFITFRLGDALPKTKLNRWREERRVWLEKHPEPWTEVQERDYHLRFSQQIDQWLDAGMGSCVLKSRSVQLVLAETLRGGDGDAFVLHSFVIMPNHVHILTSLQQGESLEKRLHRWKGGSSRSVNQCLKREGSLWQKGYFDRLIRDSEHFINCVRYVHRNPGKARLREGEFLLWEAEWVRELL